MIIWRIRRKREKEERGKTRRLRGRKGTRKRENGEWELNKK